NIPPGLTISPLPSVRSFAGANSDFGPISSGRMTRIAGPGTKPEIVLRTPVRSLGCRLVADPERTFVRAVRRGEPKLFVVPRGRVDREHDLRPIGGPVALELPRRGFVLEQAGPLP